jgi:hypothetical protein
MMFETVSGSSVPATDPLSLKRCRQNKVVKSSRQNEWAAERTVAAECPPPLGALIEGVCHSVNGDRPRAGASFSRIFGGLHAARFD